MDSNRSLPFLVILTVLILNYTWPVFTVIFSRTLFSNKGESPGWEVSSLWKGCRCS